MAYRILYSPLDPSSPWTTVRNRNQWTSAPAMGVQVVEDEDRAVDWYATGVPHIGDVYPAGNPAHVASGFDFYVWRPSQGAPEAIGLFGLTLYLRAQGVIGAGQFPFAASMDALQSAGVKLGANVNREEWASIQALVWGDGTLTPNVPTGLTVLYYADGTRVPVRSRADWALAPARGLVLAAHEHPYLGHYVEGAPVVKAGSRADADPWSLESGGIETWPLDQPRPWQTDVWGMWQDLVRDGSLASSAPLNTVTGIQLAQWGVKFWRDMERDPWQLVARLRDADNGALLPAWGRRG